MRRFLVFTIFLATIVAASFTWQAGASVQTSVEDLKFEFENYTKTHQDYLGTKATYQQHKTLPTETEAFEAFKKVLAARAAVLSSYFTVFVEKINAAAALDGQIKKDLTAEITSERNYLADYKRRALNAKNVQEAENLTSEFEAKREGWLNITSKVKGVVFTASLVAISNNSQQLIGKVENALAGTTVSEISDLNLRDEKVASSKNKISEVHELASKSQNLFLTIKFDTKRFEAMRAEDDGRKDAEKAKTLLEKALTAISEAARGF